MIKRFTEVGIAVKDLDAAIEKYSVVFGMAPVFLKAEHFPLPGLKGAVFLIGDVAISLLAPAQADSAIANFIETKGEGVFLINFEVDDIEQAMKDLAGKGVKFISEKPLPYVAGKINFGHPKSMHGIMTAFAQYKPDWEPSLLGE